MTSDELVGDTAVDLLRSLARWIFGGRLVGANAAGGRVVMESAEAGGGVDNADGWHSRPELVGESPSDTLGSEMAFGGVWETLWWVAPGVFGAVVVGASCSRALPKMGWGLDLGARYVCFSAATCSGGGDLSLSDAIRDWGRQGWVLYCKVAFGSCMGLPQPRPNVVESAAAPGVCCTTVALSISDLRWSQKGVAMSFGKHTPIQSTTAGQT